MRMTTEANRGPRGFFAVDRRRVARRGTLRGVHQGPTGRSAAGNPPRAEREPLLQEVEVVRVGLVAELRSVELVLDTEHRLAGLDECVETTAFVVLVALFVEGRVEVRQQPADLAQVVLQQRCHPSAMRRV